MQFLRSKKEAYLQKIDKDFNFTFLKIIQLLSIHSEDLSFTTYLKDKPYYTKHSDYNLLYKNTLTFYNLLL